MAFSIRIQVKAHSEKLLEQLGTENGRWQESLLPDAVRATGRLGTRVTITGNKFLLRYDGNYGFNGTDLLTILGIIIPIDSTRCEIVARCGWGQITWLPSFWALVSICVLELGYLLVIRSFIVAAVYIAIIAAFKGLLQVMDSGFAKPEDPSCAYLVERLRAAVYAVELQ